MPQQLRAIGRSDGDAARRDDRLSSARIEPLRPECPDHACRQAIGSLSQQPKEVPLMKPSHLAHARRLCQEAGRELRTLRLAAGIHPCDLGMRLGCTKPETAANRVAMLESGQRFPDVATCERLRSILGRLPTGWSQAGAIEAAVERERWAMLESEKRYLAMLLPRLVARRKETLARQGWCDVTLTVPHSGTMLTGDLRLTIGDIVFGAAPGGPLTIAPDDAEKPTRWIIGAIGSLLSGRGTVYTLASDGSWHSGNIVDRVTVGAAWNQLTKVRKGWRELRESRGIQMCHTNWSLATIAAELGLPAKPVEFSDVDGTCHATWDPRSGILRDSAGTMLDVTPHPDDAAGWRARKPTRTLSCFPGWFQDGDERIVALFDGWVPADLAVPDIV